MSDSSGTCAITKPCQICQAPSSTKCTACCNVYYCSQLHQKQDWKKHKHECTTIIEVQDDQYGRHWVASKNIKEGSLIIKELPTICGPVSGSNQFDMCVGCCVPLFPPDTPIPLGRRKSCTNCGWPVCGSDCEKLSHHANNECSIFVRNQVKYPPDRLLLNDIYTGLQVLRGILIKSMDPTTWNKLMNLQEVNNCTTPAVDPHVLSTIIRYGFNVLDDLGTTEDWKKLIGIIRVNSIAISRQEKEKMVPSLFSGLYLKGSFFSHSCVPNATRGISYSPNFELHIRAATDIKKGEMITICYYSDNLCFGTERRLRKTMESSGFVCQCVRCIDPTELGSFSSAVKCDACSRPNGYMLPKSFHDQNEPYCCSSCGDKKDRGAINNLISKLHKEISPDESLNLIQDVNKLEEFIKQYSGKKLHPNHWILQEASRGCLIGYEDTWIKNNQHLERFLFHGRKLIKFADKVSPGTSFERATLLCKVAQTLRKDVENKTKDLSADEARNRWLEIHSFCYDSLKFWTKDVQNTPNNVEMSEQTQILFTMLEEAHCKVNFYLKALSESK